MVENENVANSEVTPPEGGKEKKITWAKFVAGLKEWLRKRIVGLKRRPCNIAFLFLLITSLVFILGDSVISKTLYNQDASSTVKWSALCSFVTFLFSILVIILFMSAYPKRGKVNIVMLVILGIFFAVMVFMDVVCYIEMDKVIKGATTALSNNYVRSQSIYLTHIIFIGLTAITLAFTPLIKKGLMKINTSKEIVSTVNSMQGAIDLQETEE